MSSSWTCPSCEISNEAESPRCRNCGQRRGIGEPTPAVPASRAEAPPPAPTIAILPPEPVQVHLGVTRAFEAGRDCAFLLQVDNRLERNLLVGQDASFLGAGFQPSAYPVHVPSRGSAQVRIMFRAGSPGTKVLERLELTLLDAASRVPLGRLICLQDIAFEVGREGGGKVSVRVGDRVITGGNVEVAIPDAGEVSVDLGRKVVAAGDIKLTRERRPVLDLSGDPAEIVPLPMVLEEPVRILAGWAERRRSLDRIALREHAGGRDWITHLFATEALRFSRNGPTGGSNEEVLLRGIPQATHGALSRIFSRATIFSVSLGEQEASWRAGPGATISTGGVRYQVVHSPAGVDPGEAPCPLTGETTLTLEAPRLVPGMSLKLGLRVEPVRPEEQRGLLLQDPEHQGPPVPGLSRGADRSGAVAAVRVWRINNGTEHAYVLVRRWATVGTGPGCAVQTRTDPQAGVLARVLACGREFLLMPMDTRTTLRVDGVPVSSLQAAPLYPGARVEAGDTVLHVETVDYERMKGR